MAIHADKAIVSPVLIMAGGTGGHIFPALAVAHELLNRKIPVMWLGTHKGMEAKLVPQHGIPMQWISVTGVRGKGWKGLLFAPWRFFLSCWQAMLVIRKTAPCVVLGMGGFVAGPGGVVARLMGKPLCIHEQNAIAGLTNRILARFADRILEGYPGSFTPSARVFYTGNPVRAEFSHVEPPQQRFKSRIGPIRILVLGGSLGAEVLNKTLPPALATMAPAQRPLVRHQTGDRHLDVTQQRYDSVGVDVKLVRFFDDIAQDYAWADLVICRAGALTVAELTVVGVGAILVPYPFAVDDHQTQNARLMSEAGAGRCVDQDDFTVTLLASWLGDWVSDREQLFKMALAAKRLGKPQATQQVSDLCLQIAVDNPRNSKSTGGTSGDLE